MNGNITDANQKTTFDLNSVSAKINRGLKFGLFGFDFHCYFGDGMRVPYLKLWQEIRKLNNLDNGHGMKLSEIYPDLFIGTIQDNFSKAYFRKHKIGKKISTLDKVKSHASVSWIICNLFYTPFLKLYDYIENNEAGEISELR